MESKQKCPHCKGTGIADRFGATSETLKNRMSYLSEDYWCAGWLMGLEYALWDIMLGFEDNEFGLGRLPDARIDQLKILAHETQSWVAWNEMAGGPRPVDLVHWVAISDLYRFLYWVLLGDSDG